MDAIVDFVKNFTGTRYEDIPAPAVAAAKKEVLDSLATALGGSSQVGVGELVDMVKEWGGNEQSTIIAYGMKCSAPNAAPREGRAAQQLERGPGGGLGGPGRGEPDTGSSVGG